MQRSLRARQKGSHPLPLVGAVAARGAYTAPAQRAIAKLLTQRPEYVRGAGKAVEGAAPLAGLLGMQGVLNAE